jgi:hypothetical protein
MQERTQGLSESSRWRDRASARSPAVAIIGPILGIGFACASCRDHLPVKEVRSQASFGAPAYVAALQPLEVLRLRTVTNGRPTWWDALPDEWRTSGQDIGGHPTEFPGSHLWRDWSGGIALPAEHRLTAQGGGHSSSALNAIIGFDFNGDQAPAGFYIEAGSLSSVSSVTIDSATYADGKANSHHTYDGIWYDPASDSIYRASGSMYFTGSCTDWIYRFDRGAGAWRFLGSTGMGPLCGGSTLFDPVTRKTVLFGESSYVVIDGASDTVSPPQWIPGSGRSLNGVSAWNPSINEGFFIQGVSDGSPDMYRESFDPAAETFSLTSVRDAIQGPQDMLSTDYGPGFVFDNSTNSYWAYDPQNMPGFLYRFDPVTLTFTKYPLTGDIPDYAGGKGTYKRLALFSDWGCLGFFGKYDDNAYVIRLPGSNPGSAGPGPDASAPPPPDAGSSPAPDAESSTPSACNTSHADAGASSAEVDGAAPADTGVASAPPGSSALPPGSPRLFFSDLESGPKTGNSDTSKGQTANVDGALVSVWGDFLGSSQGSSAIRVNGAAAANVYYWGDAVPPYSPANLDNGIQGMQMVIFQISHAATDGPGSIIVTVDGATSNPLPFTIRAGRIVFAQTSGSDSGGSGDWAHPWQTIRYAKDQLGPGDILYVGDGVTQASSNEGVAMMARTSGAPGAPISLLAYPGASVSIGSPSSDAIDGYISDQDGPAVYWTFAKLNLIGQITTVNLRTGFRLVANKVSAPHGSAADGTVASGSGGNDIAVLGNELTNCGDANSISLYHVLYISAERSDTPPRLPMVTGRDIGWNYFHDNLANRAINIYSQGQFSSFLDGNKVHDNVIVNQRGDGILLGWYTTGDTWVFNNVVINAGLGPEFVDGAGSAFTCLDIRAGHDDLGKDGTRLHIYNNTFYGCGWAESDLPEETGAIELVNSQAYTLDMHNNIIYSTQPYLTPQVTNDQVDLPPRDPSAISNNLWFGAGAVPAFETSGVGADPRFVDPARMNLRLGPMSPAIDAGTAGSAASFIGTDTDGTSRPSGNGWDIGAYEFVP